MWYGLEMATKAKKMKNSILEKKQSPIWKIKKHIVYLQEHFKSRLFCGFCERTKNKKKTIFLFSGHFPITHFRFCPLTFFFSIIQLQCSDINLWKMSWRAAGLSYLKYLKVSAQVLRECLKEPVRSQVLSREKTSHQLTYWVNGKMLQKGKRGLDAQEAATAGQQASAKN